ncbi:MAG: OmpH family outer membrane protein [Crocinitomicaceae bacterium]
MKKILNVLILFLISLSVNSEEIKIGIVDVNKILKDAPQTIAANKKLDKEFSARTEKLKTKIKALEADGKKFQKESLTMSDDQREKAERGIQQRRIEIQRDERELREDMDLRRREEIGDLQEKINITIDKMAEDQNFDLILYNGIAFASSKVDITNDVIKALGGGSSKAKEESKKDKKIEPKKEDAKE